MAPGYGPALDSDSMMQRQFRSIGSTAVLGSTG